MCLAKAFVVAEAGKADGAPLMENVTKVEVDGDSIRLWSLLGQVEELQGRIASIDFMESRLVVQS